MEVVVNNNSRLCRQMHVRDEALLASARSNTDESAGKLRLPQQEIPFSKNRFTSEDEVG